MHLDLASLEELVEDRASVGSGAHGEAELGVLGVGEPVHLVKGDDGSGVGPGGGEVEHTAAADRGQLVSGAHERDARPGLVADGQEGSRRVLIEHEQQVARVKVRVGFWVGGLAVPAAVLVPVETMLRGQPRRRERLRSDLLGRYPGCLQRRGHHHHLAPLLLDQRTCCGERGGLAGAGRALDHHQLV